jgi:hypothetical protein
MPALCSSSEARQWLVQHNIRQLKRSEMEHDLDALLFLMPQEFMDTCAVKKKYLNFLRVTCPVIDNEEPIVLLQGSKLFHSYVLYRGQENPECVWSGPQQQSYQLYRSNIYMVDEQHFPGSP